jgi:D-beta-D-heptose 7-phosphate kinase/D-beta-D-heptose 1-phosphate adenosyltransferase
LVIGDIILDEYIWTKVHRISPEAPVPVCHVQHRTYRLGGAGNVAHNLSMLGAAVTIMGLAGEDSNANTLHQLLMDADINTDGLIPSNGPTITKSRVMAGKQQLCRLDNEMLNLASSAHMPALMAKLHVTTGACDAIVISDYNKGVITNEAAQAIIGHAKAQGVPVIVDPKGNQPQKYRGATCITPNVKEFLDLTGASPSGQDELIEIAIPFLRQFELSAMILTQSEAGMTHITPQGHQHYPTKAIDVSDVTGAGDTVVAAIAFGMALGWDHATIMHVANCAAGVVVSKVGTATATIDEINRYESHL